jgi:hypothetical protein
LPSGARQSSGLARSSRAQDFTALFGLSQAILIDMVLTACTNATLGALWFAQTAERRR